MMGSNITEKKEFTLPNITVYGKYADGKLYGYEARPNDGYVMYDPSDESEEVYYPPVAGFPKDYDFDRFPYVAQPMIKEGN